MMSKSKDLLKKIDQIKKVRQPWEALWKDISDYIVPRRSLNDNEEGKLPELKLFDETALEALQLLADGFQGHLVSPATTWFKLGLENEDILDKIHEARTWLGLAEKALYRAYSRSNFYEVISEAFVDGGSIGTAIVYVEESLKTGKIVMTTRHWKEMYIAEDAQGQVDTALRHYSITGRQMLQQFEKMPEELKKQIEINPYNKHDIYHLVYPREDRDIDSKLPENKAYASIYMTEDGDILRESGYDLFPYAVWRWRKNTNEVYGRSPGADCLQSVKMLNQMMRSTIKQMQFLAEPMYAAAKKSKGRFKIIPNQINYLDPGETLQKMDYSPISNTYLEMIQEQRKRINSIFRTDFFLMLARAERQMTALEVAERQGEKASVLGAIIGRLNSELLNPIMDLVFDIEMKSGRIKAPPAKMMELMGEMKIDYIGPLAQIQRQYHRTRGFQQGFATIMPLFQIQPQVMDNFDWDKIARVSAEESGFDPETLIDPKKRDKMRQQQAEMQQEKMQREQAMQEAEMMNKTSKKPEPGSMGREMMKGIVGGM
jgi:hypothetical protein